MRIAWVGHSLIHERQFLFTQYLSSLPDVEILEVYPKKWGNLSRKSGFVFHDAAGLKDTFMAGDAIGAIDVFSPDIVYCQAEWWQRLAMQANNISAKHVAKFVLFCWENLKPPENPIERGVLKDADLVVCGNRECEEIVKDYNEKTVVLPQVGVDTSLFKPLDVSKRYEGIFVGRWETSKGIHLIDRLISEGYNILKVKGARYREMPLIYNSAPIHLCLSIDTPTWKEQNAPFTNLEALACGCSIITSDSRAIVEYLSGCPAVDIIPQNDYDALKEAMQKMLSTTGGREFVVERYSNESIGRKLIGVLKEII